MEILTRMKAPENTPMCHRGYASAPESERQALHRPRPGPQGKRQGVHTTCSPWPCFSPAGSSCTASSCRGLASRPDCPPPTTPRHGVRSTTTDRLPVRVSQVPPGRYTVTDPLFQLLDVRKAPPLPARPDGLAVQDHKELSHGSSRETTHFQVPNRLRKKPRLHGS